MSRGIVLAAIGFMMIPVLGIIAAIAIPNFIAYRNRAYEVVVRTDMQRLVSAEHAYRSANGTFTADLDLLDFRPSDEHVRIEIESADEECFTATGRHTGAGQVVVSADCNGLQEAP